MSHLKNHAVFAYTPNVWCHKIELDDERERLDIAQRKLNHEMQMLRQERRTFEFQNQQETMLKQLISEKSDLTKRVESLSEVLQRSKG